MTYATRPFRTTSAGVVVRWWRDGHRYFAVNDELDYLASGTSYEDLRQHVADSAERKGWPTWTLRADHARHPFEPARQGELSGRCSVCRLAPEVHLAHQRPAPRDRPGRFDRRARD